MRAKMINEIEFNFKEPPYKRYVSNRGVSRPPVQNPKKSGYGSGLTPEEEEILQRHEERVQEIEEEIEDFESEIEDLQNDIKSLGPETFSSNELESVYGDIIQQYGEEVLDILNSGYSNEDKIDFIDKKLKEGPDDGKEEAIQIVNYYNDYHPEEVDNTEKIEEINNKIEKIEVHIQQKKNTVEKLYTKIYNIQNY